MRTIIAAFALAATSALPAAAQEAPATQQTEHFSVHSTKVGVLLDDPRTAAILQRMIPVVYANEMFQSMGRDQTLAGIQQYEPATLTDDMLAAIQAEFDKLASEHHNG